MSISSVGVTPVSRPQTSNPRDQIKKKLNDYFDGINNAINGIDSLINQLDINSAERANIVELVSQIKANIPTIHELEAKCNGQITVGRPDDSKRNESRKDRIKDIHTQMLSEINSDQGDVRNNQKYIKNCIVAAQKKITMMATIENNFSVKQHVKGDGNCAFYALGIDRNEQVIKHQLNTVFNNLKTEDKQQLVNYCNIQLSDDKSIHTITADDFDSFITNTLAKDGHSLSQDELSVLGIIFGMKIHLTIFQGESNVPEVIGSDNASAENVRILFSSLNVVSGTPSHYTPLK